MRIFKKLLAFISLIAILIPMYQCNGEAGGSEAKRRTVDNPKTLGDDGSWVYIIDNEVISKNEFESTYQLFLKVAAVSTGVGQEKMELVGESGEKKKAVLERLINSELAFAKAMKDPMFKEESGRNLILAYKRQAINQYYMYKKVFSKVKEPNEKEVSDFYKKYKVQLSQTGLKDINSNVNKEKLKQFYRRFQLNKLTQDEFGKLLRESKVETNPQVMEDYLKGTLDANAVKGDTSGKYWLIKLDDRPLHLKQVIPLIELQLSSGKMKLPIKDAKKAKYLAGSVIRTLKTVELGYHAAKDKKYDELVEGKRFIQLIQKRSITLYYLMQKVFKEIKMPDDATSRKIISDPKRRQAVINYLNQTKMPATEKNILDVARGQIYKKNMALAQKNFFDQLREAHRVRISEKYFESSAENLKKDSVK
ncbi:MAG: hypothetical protein OEZ36_11085 [Spirochaetota bacterium]|nr:hypothetical protein [Spirochaetota bacterium]